MPARNRARRGRKGFLYHGRFWTARQWRAKWATKGFKRAPRRRR